MRGVRAVQMVGAERRGEYKRDKGQITEESLISFGGQLRRGNTSQLFAAVVCEENQQNDGQIEET